METDEYYEDNSSTHIGTPADSEKQSVVEELYNTQKRVNALIRAWEGDNTHDALAGRRFLDKQRAALLGVINTTNAFTKKQGEEVQAILYRAVKAFIRDMVNEPTIKRDSYYNMVFTYWHTLELFLGLPKGGHGASVLRDALAGLHTPENEPEKIGILDDLKRRV